MLKTETEEPECTQVDLKLQVEQLKEEASEAREELLAMKEAFCEEAGWLRKRIGHKGQKTGRNSHKATIGWNLYTSIASAAESEWLQTT